MTPDDLSPLRAPLIALRRDALDQLAESDGLDGGMLALVAHAAQALAALEAEEQENGRNE
jgi:hypothetical protein